MQYLGAVIIGIISSLIATIILITFSELMRKVVLPWYADKIYRGVRIDGNWRFCRCGSNEVAKERRTIKFHLNQKGDQVTGIATLPNNNNDSVETYNVSGRIKDGFFSATSWPSSPYVVDAMSCLFRISHKDEKLRLVGHLLMMEPNDATIHFSNNEVEFCRDY